MYILRGDWYIFVQPLSCGAFQCLLITKSLKLQLYLRRSMGRGSGVPKKVLEGAFSLSTSDAMEVMSETTLCPKRGIH